MLTQLQFYHFTKMASLGKPRIRVKASDLKQAILKKNKALASKNKALESTLKEKAKALKEVTLECGVKESKIKKLSKDVQFEEEKLQGLKGSVYFNDKLLSNKLEQIDKAEKEFCEYESAVKKIEDKEKNLLDKMAKLELYKSRCEASKVELAGIQVKKDNVLDEISAVNDDIKLSIEEGKQKVAFYEDQYDYLEEKAKKHEEMVYQFEQRLIETQNLFKEEENKLKDLLTKSKQASNEQQAIKNLRNNTEDEYIRWEQKVIKVKAQVDKEEDRNKKAIEIFANWKISVLEEITKLKLKNKVDNIELEYPPLEIY